MIVDKNTITGLEAEARIFETKYNTLTVAILDVLTEDQLDELQKKAEYIYTSGKEKLVLKELLKTASEFENEKSDRNEVDLD